MILSPSMFCLQASALRIDERMRQSVQAENEYKMLPSLLDYICFKYGTVRAKLSFFSDASGLRQEGFILFPRRNPQSHPGLEVQATFKSAVMVYPWTPYILGEKISQNNPPPPPSGSSDLPSRISPIQVRQRGCMGWMQHTWTSVTSR